MILGRASLLTLAAAVVLAFACGDNADGRLVAPPSAELGAGPQQQATALTNCDVVDLSVDAQEETMLDLINAHRAANGKAPYTLEREGFNRSASWMAVDLATRADGVFSHTDSLGRDMSTRLTQCGAGSYGGRGENIAWGYGCSAQAIFNAWKASPGHNANMLGGFLQVGIAQFGCFWVTDFTTAIPVGPTPTPAPTVVPVATATPAATATRTPTATRTITPPRPPTALPLRLCEIRWGTKIEASYGLMTEAACKTLLGLP